MIRGVFFLDASRTRIDGLHRSRRISIQLRKHHLVTRDRVDGYSLSYEPAAERRLVESEQKGPSYCDYYRHLS